METTSSAAKAHGAKTLFWYMRIFSTMGICALATGALWYQFINKLHPLAILPYGGVGRLYNDRAVIWSIATLVVVAPIFFMSATLLRKAIARDEIELHRGMRQWLSFIFLLIVITVILSDLVTAVYFVLSGDYSTRFFLKVFTVLMIAGWLLTYVGVDLRSSDALATSTLPRRMGVISAVVMLVSIGIGFTLIDSPVLARAKAFDAQRASDLGQVQFGMRNYFEKHKKLPESLEQLREEGMVNKYAIEDPATNALYGYRVLDVRRYELCADFTTDNRDEGGWAYQFPGSYGESFLHGPERVCFEQNAQKRR